VSGSINATKNNGNIVRQVITVPNSPGATDGFTATQKYYYDSLNRIDDATEEIGAQTWRQDFSYDRYGNRNFVEANTTTIPRSCGSSPNFTICSADQKKYNPSISSSTNRINTSEGYSFDSSGNTTGESSGNTFVFDGENKQVEAKNSGNYTTGRYYYDGDGKRVKKIAYNSTGTEIETTIFVYDAVGKQIAEYSDVVTGSNDSRVAYSTADNLGSPRISSDASGKVISRHDYHPFGEGVQRTMHPEYSSDALRKKFAGYERDPETQLDYLGARNYSYTTGRFVQVDPVHQSAIANHPQSWNRYSYTMNNPVAWIDVDGLWTWGDGATDEYKDQFRKWYSDLQKARDGYKKGSKEYNKLDKILNTLGTEDDKNNVQIRFGTKAVDGGALKESETAATETVSRTREGNGVKAQYAITFNTALLADNNYGTLAHEGQHVIQRAAFNDSLKWAGGRWTWNPALDLTWNQRENDAFHATQIAAAGRRENFKTTDDEGNNYYLYRKSWGRVDNATMKATRAKWSADFSNGSETRFSNYLKDLQPNQLK
jgi:RHS repeat-associated protein